MTLLRVSTEQYSSEEEWALMGTQLGSISEALCRKKGAGLTRS